MTTAEPAPLEVQSVPPPAARTTARAVALECQSLARQLGNHQDDQLTLKARDAAKLVTALCNAGNVLDALDAFDPSGPAPAGYIKKLGYDPDGNVTCTFTQTPPDRPAAPPMVEGYGHPEAPR